MRTPTHLMEVEVLIPNKVLDDILARIYDQFELLGQEPFRRLVLVE